MQHLAKVLMASVAMVIGPGQAPGQQASGWVGQRVITKFGTVLKVDGLVVDRQNLKTTRPGVQRCDFRVYRVERVKGRQLFLTAEEEYISGWVPEAQVLSFDRAIDYFTRVIQADPNNGTAYVDRGQVRVVQGKFDVAIADYSEAIRIDLKDEVAYTSRGNAWYSKGDFNKAIADHDEALRIDPRVASVYNNRGAAWQMKGDFDKAIADFSEAIRIDPNDPRGYNNRAWLWATSPVGKNRDGKRAVESATRACELSRWKEPYPIGTLAAAHAEAGNFESAVKHQEKAMQRYKDEKDREKGRERLELYRATKPYHDEPAAKGTGP